MREVKHNLSNAKNRIERLQGIEVKLLINKGRNRFVSYNGFIEDIYPYIFTIRVTSEDLPLQSFSYSDVLTKNIRFYPADKI